MSGKFMMNGIEYLGGGSGGGGGNVDDVYVNGESVLDENKIAQVTSYKEVTLAEYMALPDTKLTDGIMYCIKDVGGANQFPPLIYSDEEREVGVWRDGKPLYQKTIHWTPTAKGSNETVAHGVQNIDIAIPINAFIIDTSNGEVTFLPNIDTEGGNQTDLWSQRIYRLTGNKQYFTYRLGNYSGTLTNKIIYFTFQYTKTTDTPGSGTWTTQGGYAHHYSTTEHVIGTWIDGKPLYEKTLQKTFSTRDKEGNTSYYHGNVDISSDIPNLKHGFVVVDASYYGTYPNERGFTFGYVEPDGAALVLGTLFERVNFTGYITIRYTKTTD